MDQESKVKSVSLAATHPQSQSAITSVWEKASLLWEGEGKIKKTTNLICILSLAIGIFTVLAANFTRILFEVRCLVMLFLARLDMETEVTDFHSKYRAKNEGTYCATMNEKQEILL